MAHLLLLLAATVQPLTQVRDSYPVLSPDGQRLLFQSNRSGRQALWVAKGDGSEPRLLHEGEAAPATPVWSPDGRQIAFADTPRGATDSNESEIYLMNADGGNVRRLTRTPGDDSHPHWSADGRRIFFNSARATPDLKADWGRQWIDIYSMAADGSDVRRHTECRSVCTYPVPSPDGRFVVHRRVVDGPGLSWNLTPGLRNSEVFVTALDGPAASINLSNDPAFDGWPTWSRDGRWVLFASNRGRIAFTGQIYAVRPDGSGLRQLTDGPWSRVQPSVTAAGDLLVYQGIETPDAEIGHVGRIRPDLP
jgi:TolB protein